MRTDDGDRAATGGLPHQQHRVGRALASMAMLQKVIDSTDDVVFCGDARKRTLRAFNASCAEGFRGTAARIVPGAGLADVLPAPGVHTTADTPCSTSVARGGA